MGGRGNKTLTNNTIPSSISFLSGFFRAKLFYFIPYISLNIFHGMLQRQDVLCFPSKQDSCMMYGVQIVASLSSVQKNHSVLFQFYFFPQDIVMTRRVLFPHPRRFISPWGGAKKPPWVGKQDTSCHYDILWKKIFLEKKLSQDSQLLFQD